MSWQYEGSNGVVRCDHPGCTAHVTEGSLSGACWEAEIGLGWLLVGDAGNGRAWCPDHTRVTVATPPPPEPYLETAPWIDLCPEERGE